MLGLVIAVVVPAASAHDDTAGIALLDRVATQTDTVTKALAHQGLKTIFRKARRTLRAGPNPGPRLAMTTTRSQMVMSPPS